MGIMAGRAVTGNVETDLEGNSVEVIAVDPSEALIVGTATGVTAPLSKELAPFAV